VSKIVLCEGSFDQAILESLIRLNRRDDIAVEVYGGKNKIKEFMRTFRGRSDYDEITTLAVTRDADENEKDAFKSVRDMLERAEFEELPAFPNLPAKNGEFSGEAPKTGILIVGHEGRGEIEDLCLASIQDRPGFPCVDDYAKCRQQAGFSELGAEARAWVWLVSHPKFKFSMRGVGKKEYWDWDHPAFGPLTEFLRAM